MGHLRNPFAILFQGGEEAHLNNNSMRGTVLVELTKCRTGGGKNVEQRYHIAKDKKE